MVSPTYPGVYVQEVSSGVRPIAAASTSTAAFVGLAEMGPDDEAVRITNWTEYQRHFGGFINAGYLVESVFNFFIEMILQAGFDLTKFIRIHGSLGEEKNSF